ncbi:MAG TPA: cyclopropane-fatty-acyl-phospholipid synthase family protein [Actinomycetota bacterium]
METDAADEARHGGVDTAVGPVAVVLEPLFRTLLGDPVPLPVRCWDESLVGEPTSPATIVLRSPAALQRIVRAPGELGFARAYVSGDLEVEGDLIHALRVLSRVNPHLRMGPRAWLRTVRSAAKLGLLGRAPVPPPEEARLRGKPHSKRRDASAVVHHYDVGNDFYRLVLGPTMVYSCARFETADSTLDTAQDAKCDLVCRKLALEPGMRLLDVGCGWGRMVCHAATNYGVQAVGITLSRAQHVLATERATSLGLGDLVDIRLQDYRDLRDEEFDAISSIGMLEHVGHARLHEYSAILAGVLRPGGRLLNHAITTPNGATIGRRSFIGRYVFPDGELPDLAAVVAATQQTGLEVRDVESLREHYALTLRAGLANLESNWEQALALVGPARSRIWRLYMSGSVVSFERAEIGVNQVLAVKVDRAGASNMPLTRRSYV